jgi:tetratricopeptide (TPR) repeat protein
VWRNRVELFAVQGSSTWQVELFLPVLLLGSDVQVRDTIATRRTWEQLARRAESLPALEKYAEAAQAAYLALRGETAAAIALFERVIAKLPPRNSVSWSLVRAWFAEALNAAGEHARARAVALETLSHTVPGDFQVVGRYLEPQRQLALAEAGLGNHALAATLLDDLLTKYGHEDQPLLVGLLHKARAQVAIMMHDAVGLDVHLAEMDARFRGTRHPALIAQCERLAEEAIKCGLRKRAGQGERERTSEEALQQSVLERGLSELSAAADPYDHALRLLAHETQGSAIYLYLLERNTLRLVAASTHEESPRVLEERLHQLVERTRFEATEKAGRTGSATNGFAGDLGDDDGDTVFVASIAPEAPDHAQQVALMHVQDGGQSVVFGGVIVNGAPGVVKQPLDPDFLAAIASRLQVRMVSVGG